MGKLIPSKIGRRKYPETERGLDYIFKTGKMADMSIEEVIEDNPFWLRKLIDATEFILQNDAYQALIMAEEAQQSNKS